MMTSLKPWMTVLAGAVLTILIGMASLGMTAAALVSALDSRTRIVIQREGGGDIAARFRTSNGWLTRHPRLSGGELLDDGRRARVARAIAAIPGVGGVHWAAAGNKRPAGAAEEEVERGPFHCQRDVEALLAQRVIRFREASARITPDSGALLDEVVDALKPCGGSIIAISGHSDAVGDEAINMRLSKNRASAVREALVQRGLPRDSMRAQGYGSMQPIAELPPEDPANRRIEFSVIEVARTQPTPIDIPGAR
ncbi:OmpA family protein [Croceicoccus sp. F390]|uniref:OmpA family protein n=1 Tax=Croceicoccus esteveae TaxID=3075597 RepID=A0ABU2ZJH9_9SPHN|nr:OmpA family protein [Croceicoccus sp. F390]MDT0576183.1 OmpA family protein [Croceicoccus sp. F390]